MHFLLFYDLEPDYLERRADFRAEHLELARAAQERGELVLAGALADPADGAVLLFTGDTPEAAERFAERVVDVSVFLDALGLRDAPPPASTPTAVAYHDACHLAHAQGVRRAPRALLEAIDGVTLVEPAEWELCCGSAGTYNILQPEIAARLRDRKVANIERVAPQVIATGNIGCMTQIGSGTAIPILHTVELLDWAYGGARPASLAGVAPALEAAE